MRLLQDLATMVLVGLLIFTSLLLNFLLGDNREAKHSLGGLGSLHKH